MIRKALVVGLLLLCICTAGLWIASAFVRIPAALSPSQSRLLVVYADDGLLRICWFAAVDPEAELRAEFTPPDTRRGMAGIEVSCFSKKPEVQAGRDDEIRHAPRQRALMGALQARPESLRLFLPDRQKLSEARLSTFGLIWKRAVGARTSQVYVRPGSGLIMHWSSVRLPLWAPTLCFLIYPLIFFVRGPYRRFRRRRKGLCLKCGYNLTGNVSGICPECGESI